jgi:hypothetical protein
VLWRLKALNRTGRCATEQEAREEAAEETAEEAFQLLSPPPSFPLPLSLSSRYFDLNRRTVAALPPQQPLPERESKRGGGG